MREIKLTIRPLPKQLKVLNSKAKNTILAGSYGTGKTTGLVWKLAECILQSPQSVSLLGRQTLPSLKATVLKEFRNYFPQELIASENAQDRVIRFVNGHELQYHPLDYSRDAQKRINSSNYGNIFIDQMEEIAEEMFNELHGRLRNTAGTRQLFATMNPAGHDWIWKNFKVINHPDDLLIESKTWTEGVHLPSRDEMKRRAMELGMSIRDLRIIDFPELMKYTDNPYLPIDYLNTLLRMPKTWKDRYIFCKWDAYSGLVYDDFREERHIIDPFDIPKDWYRIVGYDHGYRNPAAMLFAAIDPETGTVYIYDEIYESKLQVRLIKMIYKDKKKDDIISIHVADPSMWSKDSRRDIKNQFINPEDGTHISIPFKRANNDFDYGIQIVKKYIHYDYDIEPPVHEKLKIFRGRCPNLVEEITNYQWKELKVTTQDSPERPRKYKDHAVDALRYLMCEVDKLSSLFNKSKEKKDQIIPARKRYKRGVRSWMV